MIFGYLLRCLCHIHSQVLFRLNFLVLVLCVVMDRPYQFYYFVPLVTFWFVVIYTTMAVWPQILQKTANSRCQITDLYILRSVVSCTV